MRIPLLPLKNSRQRLFLGLLVLGLLIIYILIIHAVNERNTQPPAAVSHETILRFRGGNIGAPSPFGGLAKGGAKQAELIFDSLLEHDEHGLIPWLAKRWYQSSDGRTYIFYLRSGVKWHDGHAFTGQDVLFSFDYYRLHAPLYNDLVVDNQYIITEAHLIDPLTVSVTVNQPSATYLEKLGAIPMIPQHIWAAVSDPQRLSAKQASIGTGPYQLQEFHPAQGTYRLIANPTFWGPKPKIKVLEWVPVSDPVLAFENNDIDIISVAPDLLAHYQSPEFKIQRIQSHLGCRIVFNVQHQPALNDPTIRQAFAYGINRQELVAKIARGSAEVGRDTIVPQHHPYFNPQAPQHAYDPTQAKKLLNGKQYTFNIIARNQMNEVKIAKLIKAMLDPIGIHLQIRSVDSKSRLELLHKQDYDLALFKSGFGGDPDYLRTSFGAAKPAKVLGGYYNPELHRLGQQQLYELDPQKRKQIIFEMERIIAQQIPQLILFTENEHYVYRPAHFNGWRFRADRARSMTDYYKISFLDMPQ
ncbi:ABC transporter substrate-binding protein [Celerinatantimonas sp. YJH-8]|uniref:ABC transporter substrate-binding protein n=1 Tax=Celerinatantimonas sp. YJH-8 TaxID=3228714 RepID=UPI0038C2378E